MAGRQKLFGQDVRKAVETALDALPQKPPSERPLTTKQLVGELKANIRAAQAKGYTLEEIAELFSKNGAQLSLSSVKVALRGSGGRPTTRKTKAGTQASDAQNGS
ncbi:hypothetical protein AA919_004269 [Escherichia coli]|nr:hypothetical protein [Escherichia coli]